MQFLVERYVPAAADQDPAELGRRVEAAGEPGVRLVSAIGVPGDEVQFWLFDAPSRAAIDRALDRAAIAADRISEVSAFTRGVAP